MESHAKLFDYGRSQAVRPPEAFRFEGTEVRIRKQGDKVIIFHHPRIGSGSLEQQHFGFGRIGTIGDADRYANADTIIRQ